MSDLLHKLESNEAILLMYLSGELAGEDRAEVERMLADDAALRAQLAEIEQAQAVCEGGLRRLDRLAPAPDALIVSRRMMRAVRRQQMERLARSVEQEEPERIRRPWWSYGMVGAAAAALLLLVWWTYQEPAVTNYPEWAGPTPQPYRIREYEMMSDRMQLVQEFFQVMSETSDSLRLAEEHRQALSSAEIDEPFFFVLADDPYDFSEEF